MTVLFHDVIKDVNDKILLEIGKRCCSSDFAIRFYYNKQHPKFFKNRGALEYALRRMWAFNAFEHRRQSLEILEKHGILDGINGVVK